MGDVAGIENVTSDGIEPPLSDLESEVLPLHHEASAAEQHPAARRAHRAVQDRWVFLFPRAPMV